ncbi:hypothetical protein [Nocardioides sp. GXZ039]|uniref:hypothetical protein n=1 Tax=Nocardioides sp. GXZ039 TaxID=3136018 RepID=UPI0030F3ED73
MTNDALRVDGDRPAVARVAALPASWTTEADRLVLLALACDSYDGETSAPGADNLAAWTGLHRGTVYDVVRRLGLPTAVRPALVAIDDTRRGGRRTRYRLTLPAPLPSGEADGRQPSGEADGSVARTVGQPSGNRPASPTVETPEPSGNRPVRPDTPSPSSIPIPPPPASTGVSSSLVSWLAGKEGWTEETARAVVGLAEVDPTTTASASARLRSSPDYRRSLVRRLDDEARARRADARRCAHGRVDGTTIRGTGHNASRVCPACEAESPAEDAETAS